MNTQVMFLGSNKPNLVGVKTPYNANFVKDLKAVAPGAKWNSDQKIWFFDEVNKPDVETLVEKYFPSEDALQTVRVTWSLNRDDPRIDNVSLAYISRDSWSWKKNCPFSFRVIEGDIDSGGSRNNPGLFGKLVIEVKVRPGAVFEPTPNDVEVVDEGKPDYKNLIIESLAGLNESQLEQVYQLIGSFNNG